MTRIPSPFIIRRGLAEYFNSIEVNGLIPNATLGKFVGSELPLMRLFEFKDNNPSVYPTWEEFHTMCKVLPKTDLSEYAQCNALFRELYDCRVFNCETKSQAMKLDRLIGLLTDISSYVSSRLSEEVLSQYD